MGTATGAESISVLMACSCPPIIIDSVLSSSESSSNCATVSEGMVEAGAVAGASRRIAGVMAVTPAGAGEAEAVVILNAEMGAAVFRESCWWLVGWCCNVSMCFECFNFCCSGR